MALSLKTFLLAAATFWLNSNMTTSLDTGRLKSTTAADNSHVILTERVARLLFVDDGKKIVDRLTATNNNSHLFINNQSISKQSLRYFIPSVVDIHQSNPMNGSRSLASVHFSSVNDTEENLFESNRTKSTANNTTMQDDDDFFMQPSSSHWQDMALVQPREQQMFSGGGGMLPWNGGGNVLPPFTPSQIMAQLPPPPPGMYGGGTYNNNNGGGPPPFQQQQQRQQPEPSRFQHLASYLGGALNSAAAAPPNRPYDLSDYALPARGSYNNKPSSSYGVRLKSNSLILPSNIGTSVRAPSTITTTANPTPPAAPRFAAAAAAPSSKQSFLPTTETAYRQPPSTAAFRPSAIIVSDAPTTAAALQKQQQNHAATILNARQNWQQQPPSSYASLSSNILAAGGFGSRDLQQQQQRPTLLSTFMPPTSASAHDRHAVEVVDGKPYAFATPNDANGNNQDVEYQTSISIDDRRLEATDANFAPAENTQQRANIDGQPLEQPRQYGPPPPSPSNYAQRFRRPLYDGNSNSVLMPAFVGAAGSFSPRPSSAPLVPTMSAIGASNTPVLTRFTGAPPTAPTEAATTTRRAASTATSMSIEVMARPEQQRPQIINGGSTMSISGSVNANPSNTVEVIGPGTYSTSVGINMLNTGNTQNNKHGGGGGVVRFGSPVSTQQRPAASLLTSAPAAANEFAQAIGGGTTTQHMQPSGSLTPADQNDRGRGKSAAGAAFLVQSASSSGELGGFVGNSNNAIDTSFSGASANASANGGNTQNFGGSFPPSPDGFSSSSSGGGGEFILPPLPMTVSGITSGGGTGTYVRTEAGSNSGSQPPPPSPPPDAFSGSFGNQITPTIGGAIVTPSDGGGGNFLFQMTRVGNLDANCVDGGIQVNMAFNGTFAGLIYSLGYETQPNCIYSAGGGGDDRRRQFRFVVPLGACGSLSMPNNVAVGPSGNGLQPPPSSLISNRLYVQYDPLIQEEWDESFTLECTYAPRYEKSVQVPAPLAVFVGQGHTVSALAEPPRCAMVVLGPGRGLNFPPVNGPVQIGDTLTLAVRMSSSVGGQHYDMLVRNCFATDGGSRRIDLTDGVGCTLRPKLIGDFAVAPPGVDGGGGFGPATSKILYTFMKVFRFTGSRALYLQCDVLMCVDSCAADARCLQSDDPSAAYFDSNTPLDDKLEIVPLNFTTIVHQLKLRQQPASPTTTFSEQLKFNLLDDEALNASASTPVQQHALTSSIEVADPDERRYALFRQLKANAIVTTTTTPAASSGGGTEFEKFVRSSTTTTTAALKARSGYDSFAHSDDVQQLVSFPSSTAEPQRQTADIETMDDRTALSRYLILGPHNGGKTLPPPSPVDKEHATAVGGGSTRVVTPYDHWSSNTYDEQRAATHQKTDSADKYCMSHNMLKTAAYAILGGIVIAAIATTALCCYRRNCAKYNNNDGQRSKVSQPTALPPLPVMIDSQIKPHAYYGHRYCSGAAGGQYAGTSQQNMGGGNNKFTWPTKPLSLLSSSRV